jgi:hypothetical protein
MNGYTVHLKNGQSFSLIADAYDDDGLVLEFSNSGEFVGFFSKVDIAGVTRAAC